MTIFPGGRPTSTRQEQDRDSQDPPQPVPIRGRLVSPTSNHWQTSARQDPIPRILSGAHQDTEATPQMGHLLPIRRNTHISGEPEGLLLIRGTSELGGPQGSHTEEKGEGEGENDPNTAQEDSPGAGSLPMSVWQTSCEELLHTLKSKSKAAGPRKRWPLPAASATGPKPQGATPKAGSRSPRLGSHCGQRGDEARGAEGRRAHFSPPPGSCVRAATCPHVCT